MTEHPTIALVSCVKAKRPAPSPAHDLYTSHLFRALRGYAEAIADRWYILSAEHGLVDPDRILAPYDRTLNKMPKRERDAWAERVRHQISEEVPDGAEIVILAGARYREGLEEPLRELGFTVTVPLEGLPIGKQLQRLKQLAEGSGV